MSRVEIARDTARTVTPTKTPITAPLPIWAVVGVTVVPSDMHATGGGVWPLIVALAAGVESTPPGLVVAASAASGEGEGGAPSPEIGIGVDLLFSRVVSPVLANFSCAGFSVEEFVRLL